MGVEKRLFPHGIASNHTPACLLSVTSCQPGSCQQTDGAVSGKSVANNRQNQEIQSLTD